MFVNNCDVSRKLKLTQYHLYLSQRSQNVSDKLQAGHEGTAVLSAARAMLLAVSLDADLSLHTIVCQALVDSGEHLWGASH